MSPGSTVKTSIRVTIDLNLFAGRFLEDWLISIAIVFRTLANGRVCRGGGRLVGGASIIGTLLML